VAPAERLRRIGAIGDIHCEDAALDRALSFFDRAGVDLVVSVGDVVDGYGDADRCCELLMERGVVTVRGNHERWLLLGEMRTLPDATADVTAEHRAFLASLPAVQELDTVAGKLMLCHGVGEDDMASLNPDTSGYGLMAIPSLKELMVREDLAFMLGGHTHRRMVREFSGLTVINAGTLHRDFEPCVALLDLGALFVEFHDVGSTVTLADVQILPVPG